MMGMRYRSLGFLVRSAVLREKTTPIAIVQEHNRDAVRTLAASHQFLHRANIVTVRQFMRRVAVTKRRNSQAHQVPRVTVGDVDETPE